MTELRLGSIPISGIAERTEILTMLLWGKPGCGKTVLAATAPGKKLWLQFDPAGTASLRRNADVVVADFSAYNPLHIQNFKQGNIIEKDLHKLIKEQGITTVVVDSLTSFGQLALMYAIQSGKANGARFTASIEAPGLQAYGIRASMTLDFCAMVLRACVDNGVHCILIAHDQDVLDVNDKGEQFIREITVSLGGQTKAAVPVKISEIWYMADSGRERRVYIRPHGIIRPMRTRMFIASDAKDNSFKVEYDQDKDTGAGIHTWYEQWRTNGFDKIAKPA